jgi:hypothetical protein
MSIPLPPAYRFKNRGCCGWGAVTAGRPDENTPVEHLIGTICGYDPLSWPHSRTAVHSGVGDRTIAVEGGPPSPRSSRPYPACTPDVPRGPGHVPRLASGLCNHPILQLRNQQVVGSSPILGSIPTKFCCTRAVTWQLEISRPRSNPGRPTAGGLDSANAEPERLCPLDPHGGDGPAGGYSQRADAPGPPHPDGPGANGRSRTCTSR